ncbi:CCA tRNA nucleotidyltransferase [Roseovarius sp. TE539]|uniref:CCA tRNA nucleotidyltransferase n=1 Tax=Roseovarius sp. TE539 TaxID=2249812 RepID=UPI000DE07278|nr:CCA tRNA nucleotidyltransferase [Roseovarius sp. TE539]RBI77607.1 CCA tRNA nucleotidyltransferase [Roseovarius sp. TE539]
MKVDGDWIADPAAQAVCRNLEEAGHHALFVGGCVRNALLGMPVTDIDIATDARPETVIRLARESGLRAVPTGIEHGTVTVVADGRGHEVTTFRRDVETDGRRAVVAYADTPQEDAHRRDFTMNALYARRDGTILDPLGGLADLNARRVRFIDDPDQRIREDYLRILRFFRFHAWYGAPGSGLDAEGLAAVACHVDGLAGLARERVGTEMIKLLSAPDPAPAVAAMRHASVLSRILPGADDAALAPLVHEEVQAGTAPDPIRRLAALGGAEAAARLRLSKVQGRRLTLLRDAVGSTMPPAELGYRYGAQAGMDILLLRAALLRTPVPAGAAAELDRGAAAIFPVTGKDLMPDYSGPELGARLAELERRWIESDFSLTREALL